MIDLPFVVEERAQTKWKVVWFSYYTLDWVHVYVNFGHAEISAALGNDNETNTEGRCVFLPCE